MSQHRAPARPRSGRLAVAGTTLALAAPFVAVASGAGATIDPAHPIEAGKSITVLHNIDMVVLTGYTLGEPITVKVLGKPGGVVANAVNTDEGPGLEINHGVEPDTPVRDGDCWEGGVPDIRPGDTIMVTTDGGADTDAIIVDDLRFTGRPVDRGDYVAVPGVAFRANGGGEISTELLDAAEFRNNSGKYRATPEVVGVAGGFELRYHKPYTGDRNREGLDEPARKRALMTEDGHAVGFGHTEPPAKDSQMIEGFGAAGGPAEGCPGGPPPEDPVDPEPEPEPEPPADTVRPKAIPVSPTAGQTGVGRGTNVTVRFDEAVRENTVTGANLRLHRVSNTGTVLSSVPAALQYDVGTRRAVLDPTAIRLTGNARYRVTVSVGILDTAGNQLVRKVYYFRTRA